MWSVPVDLWLGHAAAVWSRCWGGVPRRSEETGFSRTPIAKHAERVERAVVHEVAGGVDDETLGDETQRLQEANEALWAAWSEAEGVPEAKQREFAVTGSAMGWSLGPIAPLLAIVLFCPSAPSRAKVGRWVSEANRQAGGLCKGLDGWCQRWGLVLCLDAIFFPRVPMLMAVEPVSLAWLAGQRGPDRSGTSWCEVIERWPELAPVIAAGGSGLERGGQVAHERRPGHGLEAEAGPTVSITMGLDVLQTQRERERVLPRQWKQAGRPLEAASEAAATVARSQRQGREARGVAGASGRAWRQAERFWDEAVRVEEVVKAVQAALLWFDAQGHLLSRDEAQAQLEQAREQLRGSPWHKVRRLLHDERPLSHFDRLPQQRAKVVAEPRRRASLTRWWYVNERLRHSQEEEGRRLRLLVVMEPMLCDQLGPQWQGTDMTVDERLRQAVRASRAVEGINSVMRMHQGRHRHGSQGLLDLKRFYGNCRGFREGKRKGRHPSDLLGLKLPTSHWGQLLQMDPDTLEQKLLTQYVAA